MCIQLSTHVCLGKVVSESNVYLYVLFPFRLGQACDHIAAILFYIERNANDPELPTEISKTSKPMTWHQPPKKTVPSACANNIKFVKRCHGDDLQLSSQLLQRFFLTLVTHSIVK